MSTFTPQADAPRRRHWLTEPGEPLLAPVAPIGIIERFLDVIRTSGLSPASLCMSRVGAVPVPVPDSPGGGPRAFEGLNPASAWLPLFWLPEHLTRRVMIQEEDDSVRFEDDDEWAVRVLLALDLAGIYDPENGWFDVLASAGLDVNDPEHLARIQAWLDGGDDADAFVAGDERQRRLHRPVAACRVQIGVADAGSENPHQHFVWTWIVNCKILNTHRCAWSTGKCASCFCWHLFSPYFDDHVSIVAVGKQMIRL